MHFFQEFSRALFDQARLGYNKSTTQTDPAMSKNLRDSAKIRDKAFTGQFLIGAEFEMYICDQGPPTPDKPKSIPKAVREQYGHLFEELPARRRRLAGSDLNFAKAKAEALRLLSSAHPEIPWSRHLSFATDASLSERSRSECGIEIVLAHCSGPKALELMGKMFSVFGSAPHVRTDSSTGFHLNASFADQKLNCSAVLAKAPEFIPISELRLLFGRARNTHCEDNSKSSIDTGDFLGDGDRFLDLLKRSTGISHRGSNWRLSDLSSHLNALKERKCFEAFQSLVHAEAQKTILYQWDCERPACAPRLSHVAKPMFAPSGTNYMEFRMMGGTDYLKRPLDIAAGIQSCLAGLEHAAKKTPIPSKAKAKANAKAPKA